MLNDLKEWAIDKGVETVGVAQGVANEMQTTSVMDWSGTVWLIIGGVVLLVLLNARG